MKKIITALKTRKTLLLLIAAFAGVLLLAPDIALAAEESGTDGTSNPFNDIAEDLMKLVTIAFSFLNILLYPLVALVGSLMDNELIIGVGMEDKLRTIWVTIRDWVNIFFVLALVLVALYNVLGIAGDGSNYALKAILPKIVIGLVAVNFSFLAGKVLLDFTAVLTNAVYALPTSLEQWEGEKEAMRERLCWQGNTQREVDDAPILSLMLCEIDGENFSGIFNEFGTSFTSHFGAHNVSVALMVNMGQVTDVNLVEFSEKTITDQFATLTLQTLYGILMFLMFGFAYVAMVVVLIVRVVILWICLALSPIVVLMFIFPDLASAGGGELDLKGQFFKHLFVPVVMGVVLAIGFTMLSVFQGSASGSWLGNIGSIEFDKLGDTDQVKKIAASFGKDISDFQDLLIAVAAVIIIWVGTFAAASQTLASTWTNMIKEAGEKTGKFLASAPLYATFIPVTTKDGKTEGVGLMNILGAIPQGIENKMAARRQKTQTLADQLFPGSPGQKMYNDTREQVRRSPDLLSTQDALRKLAESESSRSLTTANWRELLQSSNRIDPDLKTKLLELDDTKFDQELKKHGSDLHNAMFGIGQQVNWGSQAMEGAREASSTDITDQGKARIDAGIKAQPKLKGKSATESKDDTDLAAVYTAVNVRNDELQGQIPQNFFSGNVNDPVFTKALEVFRSSSVSEEKGVGVLSDVGFDASGKVDAESFVASMAKNVPVFAQWQRQQQAASQVSPAGAEVPKVAAGGLRPAGTEPVAPAGAPPEASQAPAPPAE